MNEAWHMTPVSLEQPCPSLLWTPALQQLIDLALQEDLGRGDVTTEAVGGGGMAHGTILCREPIVACGLPLIPWIMARIEPGLQLCPLVKEGDTLKAGSSLATLSGAAESILRLERTVLNFLMRLCGVATLTRRYVVAIQGTDARLVDTRKTVPGWRPLDKYAVRVGGADNHRLDLGSGILIKDNHIVACGSITEAVRRARAFAPHPLRIEVEVESLAGAREAVAAGAEILLLDNLTPAAVHEIVHALGEKRVILEVSGGITMETVRDYALAGAQLISVGALTHSAPAVNLSLDLETSTS